MADIDPTLPAIDELNATADPKILAALTSLVSTINALDATNLADSAVTAAKLATDAVTTAKILDANVTLAKLAAEAWTAYTPTVTTATLGSGGSVGGRSAKLGRTVVANGGLFLGTGGSLTGSDVTVTLPYAATTSQGQIGTAFAYDSSTGYYSSGVCVVATGAPTVLTFRLSETASATPSMEVVGATTPFTWDTSDYLRWSITYETAA